MPMGLTCWLYALHPGAALCVRTGPRAAIPWPGVGCRGCYRLMAPLVEPFRRSTGSPACALRVERRRKPWPPVQSCAQGTKFRRARACNLGWHYLYEGFQHF
jgi:hypothetical protein